ncbi:MAG: BcpO-related WXXGXW repeat protein [Chloroflexia bacterium]|nr:BcpO-related WXXGXW repeat protein [Chloroflexia bacterium]
MKKVIALLFFVFIGSTITLSAQVVENKPKEPSDKLLKKDVEKPTTNANWVWVPGEWDWKKKSKEYKWVKGHWEKAPDGKNYWQSGYWKKVKKGWEWSLGYWK